MSQAVHLVGKSVVHGSGLTEGKCLPCPGVSAKRVTLSPCSSRFYYGLHSQAVWPLGCTSVGAAYVCSASSSNNGYNRRNSDYSRQNKHGFSRGKNRQPNDERERDRDGFESLDVSDILSSKNGPYLSLSSSPKFQATAAPGPREKEIVELFRKVQAQLRERAALRDEKRNESAPGQGKDNETVDSLLKLLRKHSTEQAKRSSAGGSRESSYDQQGQNGQYIRGKIMGSINSNNGVKDPGPDSMPSSSRPVSSFQRKSPVHQMKFQPPFSDEDIGNSVPLVDSSVKGKNKHVEEFPEPNLGLEFDEDDHEESESDLEAVEPELVQLLEGDLSSAKEAIIVDNESDDDDDEDEDEEEQMTELEDLSAWKLPELRALAKSRGIKGYSKIKKSELVGLLSGTSV